MNIIKTMAQYDAESKQFLADLASLLSSERFYQWLYAPAQGRFEWATLEGRERLTSRFTWPLAKWAAETTNADTYSQPETKESLAQLVDKLNQIAVVFIGGEPATSKLVIDDSTDMTQLVYNLLSHEAAIMRSVIVGNHFHKERDLLIELVELAQARMTIEQDTGSPAFEIVLNDHMDAHWFETGQVTSLLAHTAERIRQGRPVYGVAIHTSKTLSTWLNSESEGKLLQQSNDNAFIVLPFEAAA